MYSLLKPIAIESLQTAFSLYNLIEQAEFDGEKVYNYALAYQVEIKLEQRNTKEECDAAHKHEVVSIAVSWKNSGDGCHKKLLSMAYFPKIKPSLFYAFGIKK